MAVNLDLQLSNLGSVQQTFERLGRQQARTAIALALNDTGRSGRLGMVQHLQDSFDRPTKWVSNSPKYRSATPDKLTLAILPTVDSRNAPSRGGAAGVDPQYILQAQEFGGRRADKRSESALRRAGILPAGMQTAIPQEPFPGSDDGKGNLRGAFVQQLLSYLQAFGEQGYRANMTDRKKKNLHRGTARNVGRRYFVTYGRWREGRASNLPPGIWAATGSTGAIIKPVLMFTRPGTYRPRISMERLANSLDLQKTLEKKLRFRIREAAGV